MLRKFLALFALAVSAHAIPCLAQTAAPPPPMPALQSPSQSPLRTPSADEAQFLKTAEVFVRKLFAWGPDFQVKLGPLSQSPASDFYLVPVQVTVSGQADTGVLYISKDGKILLRGDIFETSGDPYAANRAKLRLEGNPSKGPTDAKVTLVEFSDFECPHCRLLYEAVKKTIAPRYPQIRIVYKDLPIPQIHPWAMTAAIGARCAYMQSPAAFWNIHDALFENQEFISAANIWERLVDYAGQAALDKDAFKACLTAPDALKAVEANVADSQILSVTSTPTVFVNGRPIVGGDPTTIQQFIDFELGPKTAAQTPAPPAPATPAKPAPKPASKP
jgi:protein-disulfide isomerase